MKIKISEKILSDFDKDYFSPKYEGVFFTLEEGEKIQPPRVEDGRSLEELFPFWDMNDAHLYYRILGYFSTFYDNEILVDIGTRRGHSAASLAYNENNMVYTYNNRSDQTPENSVFEKMTNIKPFVLNDYDDGLPGSGQWRDGPPPLGNILYHSDHKNILLKSSFIFMDVDPHDGGKENALFDFLVENNYKGITIWDDTGSQLKKWFEEKMGKNKYHIRNNIRPLIYYNLDNYSWKDGTGVICFGEQEIILE